MNLRKLSIWLFFSLILAIGLAVPLLAQNGEIILTVAIQEWQQDIFTDEAFADFVAAHPNVKVVVQTMSQDSFFTPAQYDLESFQEGAAKFAASADVLLISRYNMTPEFTRGGYLLDLAPLVAGDVTLNTDDFYPAVWQSFQWDRGVWALPITASVSLWIYDKTAFDEAGVTYPDENWTFQQLADAARALTQRDADGSVTLPGFMTFERDLLFRVFSSAGFYDPNTLPNQPLLVTPELETLLAQYQQLVDEGISEVSFNGSTDDIPLQIGRTWLLSQQGRGGQSRELVGALLPGGTAGLEVEAFAVSSGTLYPELSYELAKYLTLQPAIVNRFFADAPARRSLVGVETDDETQFFREIEPEVQALIDEALVGALPVSELRFASYLSMAFDKITTENIDPAAALQEIQELALTTLQTVDDSRTNQVVMVVTPVPTPVLSSGDVALKFRLSANISPLPNRELWDQLIADFTASDPQVRHIELDTGFGGSPDEEVDCYFQSFSPVTSMDVNNPTILPLDPFMDADPNFDRNDLIPGVLEKMQKDNMTWGFPIVIEPEVLWYNADVFAEAGVPTPTNGWTAASFTDALRSIKPLVGSESVFVPSNSGSSYLLILFAAYGALPYDTRTNPPTLNLTDPATLDAMRQVLNLAKDGYIKYTELANFGGGGSGGSDEIPVYSDTLNTLNWRLQFRNQQTIEGTQGYMLTTYPSGTQFTPVAYNVSGAYISNTTLYPEACYRWISAFAARPDLFSAMPVRRSLFAEWGEQQGEDVLTVYQTIDAVLQSPNAVVLTGSFGNTEYFGSFVEQLWMNRVFDNYVLNGNDELEAGLAQVETDIAAYRVCMEDLAPFDPSATLEEQNAWGREFGRCAISVDPLLEEFFSFPE